MLRRTALEKIFFDTFLRQLLESFLGTKVVTLIFSANVEET